MSVIHFNELRAKRDALADDLKVTYFWGREEWIDRIVACDWGIYGKALEHLTGNRKWDGCQRLDNLYSLCRDIQQREEAACNEARAGATP